jgi:hypothetical protein
MCEKVTSAGRSSAVLDDEKTEPAEEVHQREVSSVLLETLERLPHHLAETLTVFYIQEKSVSETAELLGVSEATVKTRLHRGRELMRQPLERILDEELRHLKPSRNLTPGVMAMLPGLSMKTGWTAGLSSIGLLFVGSQIVIFIVMTWAMNLLYRHSFKNSNDYRATLYRSNLLKMIPIMVIAFSSGIILPKYFGEQGLFMALGLFGIFFTIINLPNDIRIWKVGNKTFLYRNIIFSLICLFYMAIIFLPQLKDFQMITSIGYGLMGLVAFKGQHMRQDFNLFLREVKHELPLSESRIQPLKLSANMQKDFACFLGRKRVIFGDEYLADGTCVLGFPPVKNYRFFPRSWRSLSKVWIGGQGNFTASLSQEDLNELEGIEKRKFGEDEIAAMEWKVAGAVRASAMFFSQGKLEQARGALCVLADSEIFKNGDFIKTPFARFGLVLSIFLLAVVLAGLVVTIIHKLFFP